MRTSVSVHINTRTSSSVNEICASKHPMLRRAQSVKLPIRTEEEDKHAEGVDCENINVNKVRSMWMQRNASLGPQRRKFSGRQCLNKEIPIQRLKRQTSLIELKPVKEILKPDDDKQPLNNNKINKIQQRKGSSVDRKGIGTTNKNKEPRQESFILTKQLTAEKRPCLPDARPVINNNNKEHLPSERRNQRSDNGKLTTTTSVEDISESMTEEKPACVIL